MTSGIAEQSTFKTTEYNNGTPFEEAHITMIEGDQGKGKSGTGTGLVVDAYDIDCVRVWQEETFGMSYEVKSFDRDTRIARIIKNGEIKHIRIPDSYKLWTPMKVFSNFHLWGIRYVYCPSFWHILDWLKKDIIVDGWLLLDEAYIGVSAHESMTKFGKEWRKSGFQYRKMRLEVVIITPVAKLIEKYLRLTPTRHILCKEANQKTGLITIEITEKGVPGKKEITYDSRRYRRNYNTNERIKQ